MWELDWGSRCLGRSDGFTTLGLCGMCVWDVSYWGFGVYVLCLTGGAVMIKWYGYSETEYQLAIGYIETFFIFYKS